MKKIVVLLMVIMLTVFASAAMAKGGGGGNHGYHGYQGSLLLFQKCDETNGCPEGGTGPWPILPTGRWGQMKYNLLGDTFKFSFEGKKLVPDTDYTLIYYPDPWPGDNLICLGYGKANRGGNLQIHGDMEILTGLPTPDDANFLPAGESGAVGAKIWLVLSSDVQCTEGSTKMLNWTPQDYLFEGNLIAYQYSEEQPCKFRKK